MKTETYYPKKLNCLRKMIESAQWAENVWLELGELDMVLKYRMIKYRLREWRFELRKRYFDELDSHFELAKSANDITLMADIVELKLEVFFA